MKLDIAIDLGSNRIRVYVLNKGIMINEPAVVALNLDTNEIIAVGREAYKMLGRTSDKIDVFYPVERGVISDFEFVEEMILRLFKKVDIGRIVMPRVVACIPSGITELEKKAVVSSISVIGVRKIYFIEKSIASAIGSGLDTESSKGHMIVSIGGGISEISIISLNGVVSSKTLKIAGNQFDTDIIKYVKKNRNLIIGKKTAETAKIAIGGVYSRKMSFDLKGRQVLDGLPQCISFSDEELKEAIMDSVSIIISEIEAILRQIPPELSADICLEGITLTGGSALIYGLNKLIEKRTGLKVRIPTDPQNCAAIGAGISTKYIDTLEKREYGKVNPLSHEY